ncbi:hypothetical protein BK648_24430 [Pseudomonas poae]|uniref:Enoyl reductase (ER) domain-containing protein n=1 Tax=Pseudomonas poae TaxID=200451 RepID=A0A423ERI5_9PSED|nr:zinc-binding dehydrogenase [Pseudomonas poae]ROM33912.1 hypothetical protein BK648_24430 [Pseudomonas poae]
MKAFVIDRYGKSAGRLGEAPAPIVGAHDVLIEVHASSVNVLDAKIRKGEFKLILPYSLPLVLGNDLAGVVVEVGAHVQRFKPGDEVYAVLNSLGADVLAKSLKVLKRGGQLISISGPPTAQFAQEQGLSWPLQQVMRLLSLGIRRKARKQGVRYAFVFMRADGAQLQHISALIEAGVIRPVIDRAFTFEATAQALAYVEQGRARGKVVITLK